MMAKKSIHNLIEKYLWLACFVMLALGATFFTTNQYYQSVLNKEKAQHIIDPQYLVTMINGDTEQDEQWVSSILVHAPDADSAYQIARSEVKANNKSPNELSRIITIERMG